MKKEPKFITTYRGFDIWTNAEGKYVFRYDDFYVVKDSLKESLDALNEEIENDGC